jgi:hypothetical protein
MSILIAVGGPVAAERTDYGSLWHYSDLPEVLFLTGEIRNGDSFQLRRAMRDQKIRLVVTTSPGGSLYEGLQMAAILHDNEIGTFVPQGASCESSCAHIFLGGFNRLAVGELGVHQFYSDRSATDRSVTKGVASATTQYTTSDIIGIMNQFDTPPFVYEKMFGTREIYYFKATEKLRLNRNVDDVAFMDRLGVVEDYLADKPELLKRPVMPRAPEIPVAAVSPPLPAIPNTPALERMPNVDFFGMDITATGHRDVSIENCDTLCRANPNCAAWSYVTATRWCWPKSGIQNYSYAPGTISRVVKLDAIDLSIFERPFLEVTGKDVVGYDIFQKGLRNKSLEECRDACALSSSCRAFTWVARHNWCFPKYGVSQMRDQLGVVSGIKNEN